MEAEWTEFNNGVVLKIDGRYIFEFKNKGLEEAREFFFDRWAWETGSEEDRDVFEALDAEIELRKKRKKGRRLNASWTMESSGSINMYGVDLEKELVDAISKELT